MNNSSIERIGKYIEELAKRPYNSDNSGGVTRLAFSNEESNTMEWIRKKMTEEFDYECEYDSFLNLHAYDPRHGEKRILVGTHVDSVMGGGKFDGVVGLIVFVEALYQRGSTDFSVPVDFVVFRAEESTMFKIALLGSKVATGVFDLEDLQQLNFKRRDDLDDALLKYYFGDIDANAKKEVSLLEILSRKTSEFYSDIRKGCWLFRHPTEDYLAYFEVHIEQGRVLYDEGINLGIVNSIRAPIRNIITLEGRTDHSGATPMGEQWRRDVLCAASECILCVEDICSEESENGVEIVGTVGEIHIPNMGINKIPGYCFFTLDLRGNDSQERERIYKKIRKKMEEICRERDIHITFEETEKTEPVSLVDNGNSSLPINHLKKVMSELGYSYKIIPSGAGHDAASIAAKGIPVGFLFIPCREGVSHAPDEYAEAEDIHRASRVLLSVLTREWEQGT